jgi:hypothetical protein
MLFTKEKHVISYNTDSLAYLADSSDCLVLGGVVDQPPVGLGVQIIGEHLFHLLRSRNTEK